MRIKIIATGIIMATCAFGNVNDIFKVRLVGIQVQSFSPTYAVNGFTVTDSSDGYKYLIAHSFAGESGAIIRTKLTGTAFKSFSSATGDIQSFTIATSGEWVYLIANDNTGQSDSILKTKLSNTAVQDYSCSGVVIGFTTSGPDSDGWVYLGVVCGSAGVEEQKDTSSIAFTFGIQKITPNPFSDRTTISYSIAKQSRVKLGVYDRSGRLIRALLDTEQKPGAYNVLWQGIDESGKKVVAGTYFIELATDKTSIKKIIVVR